MNGSNIPKIEDLLDGYSLDGYIAPVNGVHGDLSFRYRPIDPLTARRLAVKKSSIISNKGLSEEDKELLCEIATIETVLANVLEWNLQDGEKIIPVDLGAVLRYFPDYRYTRLMQIVMGGFASDPKPEAKPSDPPAGNPGDLEAAEKN